MSTFEIASTLLAFLRSPIAKEISSIWGYKTEIESFERTIGFIKAVLLDAEEKQFENHQIRYWLQNLREPLYDAEDLFEEIAFVVGKRKQLVSNYSHKLTKEGRIFFSPHNQLSFAVRIHRKIKKIREKLDAVAKDRNAFGLIERQPHEIPRRRDETQSFVPPKIVIGRDNDKATVIDMLFRSYSFDGEEDVPVISIVGIGGMGKTTLAQLVFNDKRVEDKFELKMWACVSDEFNVKQLVRSILASTSESGVDDSMTLEQLQRQLRGQIDGRKYLLVLDDVWNEDPLKWFDLRRFLLGGEEKSRIVVTTRSKEVANAMKASCVHILRGLSDEDAFFLFTKMAFCSEEEVRENREGLVDIGKDIVQKCANVPLAIMVVGSALRGKEKSKWLSVRDTDLAKIRGVEQRENEIMQILRISYNHLSPPLKRCFSYCALFPKDYVILKEELATIWQANGCMTSSSDDAQCVEDTCDEYFSILLQSCFFQDVETNQWGVIFKVHDLIHDLAKEIAGEEIFSMHSSNHPFSSKNRHLFLSNDRQINRFLSNAIKPKKHRTFIYKSSANDPGFNVNTLISQCKFLRVLNLEGSHLQTLPRSIGSLFYLRYLNVSRNYEIRQLPKSITELWNLQCLLLWGCLRLKELPRDMQKLVNLKQLVIQGCGALSCMPPGMGSLTSLYTLDMFVVGAIKSNRNIGQLEDLKHLKSLRGGLKIKFHDKITVHMQRDHGEVRYLMSMEKLATLCIEFSDGEAEETLEDNKAILEKLQPPANLKEFSLYGYNGESFPRWVSNLMDDMSYVLPNLVDLWINDVPRCHCLPRFSQLQFLKRLEIVYAHSIEYMEEDIDINDEGVSPQSSSSTTTGRSFFPCLEVLVLYSLPKLKGWWRNVNVGGDKANQDQLMTAMLPHFPCLSELEIRKCPELSLLPATSSSHVAIRTDNVNIFASTPWKQFLRGLYSLDVELDVTPSFSTIEVEEAIRSIPNSLKILECSKIRALPKGLKHLKSLKELKIKWSDYFTGREDEADEEMMPWKAFENLKILDFWDLRKAEALPMGVQSITTLQSITILRCPNFTEIPGWMPKLTNLKSLKIIWGGISKERCKEPMGEEWSKIQHIPCVVVMHAKELGHP